MPRESYMSDLKEHLESLGMWDKVTGGKINCYACKRPVNLENFGMVFNDDDKYQVTCNDMKCIKSVTMSKE